MVDLGVRIQQLRMERNMSQSELGKALNRSKSVISAYENDLRIPPLEVLTEIALIFNVSLDYLVGIDKLEMVSVEGLNGTQKAIIHSLIHEFSTAPLPISRPHRAPAKTAEPDHGGVLYINNKIGKMKVCKNRQATFWIACR